jgi:hypothetical protein
VLCFISTGDVFGTPLDVTLQEIALETFFPGGRGPRPHAPCGGSPAADAAPD